MNDETTKLSPPGPGRHALTEIVGLPNQAGFGQAFNESINDEAPRNQAGFGRAFNEIPYVSGATPGETCSSLGNPVSPAPVASPPWADLTARWGATHRDPAAYPPGVIPWLTQEVPPWGSLHQDIGHEQRRTHPAWIVLLVALTGVALLLAGVLTQRSNWLPASVPLIGADSGYAACKAIASGDKPTAGSKVWSQDDYRAARRVFIDSRYPDVRTNGVRLIDIAWQLQGLEEGETLGALAYIGAFTNAYTGLSGGCADLGFTLPKLGEK